MNWNEAHLLGDLEAQEDRAMTDTTHEAPERIWLTRDETYWQNDLGIVFTFQNGSHDVEYVRADRIEKLETENKNLRHMIIDQIEGAGDDPEIMAASRAEWAARAKAAEAKLRKCVGALGDISNGEPEWPDDPQKELDWCRNRATTTLAELKRSITANDKSDG